MKPKPPSRPRPSKTLHPNGGPSGGHFGLHLGNLRLGFHVLGLGFQVVGLGSKVSKLGFEVLKLGFEVLKLVLEDSCGGLAGVQGWMGKSHVRGWASDFSGPGLGFEA